MSDSFQVAEPAEGEGELDEQRRHEMVAAQLRGEAKAAGQPPEAVEASVAEELEGLGLEPNEQELGRRYEEVDPDLPVTQDRDQDTGSSVDDPL
ncbi:hypothetical protein [Pedococcus sp. 5OH_020]|uniref:hypothetical protein n=1 Tax=Pedococcus sp. 5OH_020 TaxID=2989814 RepID=UPI0022E9D4CF|nr:hypothetical protein [Pedococcus sp. 5OH_020]